MSAPNNPNASRAKRVEEALFQMYGVYATAPGCVSPPEAEEMATDLLSDLRHFCDKHGLELAKLDRMAHQHYIAEVAEWGVAK